MNQLIRINIVIKVHCIFLFNMLIFFPINLFIHLRDKYLSRSYYLSVTSLSMFTTEQTIYDLCLYGTKYTRHKYIINHDKCYNEKELR